MDYVFLSGKAKWARLVQPDLKYKVWSVVLYLNTESYEKIMALKETKGETQGILNVIKKDEDGYYCTLKRPTERSYQGQLRGMNPPVVVSADGKTMFTENIGNGSDITCKLEYYKYKKPTGGRGSAIRLFSVRVDNLVPYETKKDFNEEQTQAVSGLLEQPKQEF